MGVTLCEAGNLSVVNDRNAKPTNINKRELSHITVPGTVLDTSCVNMLNLHSNSGRRDWRDCHYSRFRGKETEAKRGEAPCLGAIEFFGDKAGLETQVTGSWFHGLELNLLQQMGECIGRGGNW